VLRSLHAGKLALLATVFCAPTLAAGATALAAAHEGGAQPCGALRLVRTLTLTLPGGHASFNGFGAGRTYLVRLSGSVRLGGAPLGLIEAPGAFTVNVVSNDALLSSLPASRLAVPGRPGAYQFAVQLDPSGKALRYNVPPRTPSAPCPLFPEQPALPGGTLDLVGSPPDWNGTVRVDVFVYESRARTASWTGHWDTTYGFMTLTQRGNRVTGGYVYKDKDGRIAGTVSGKVLRGTWSQLPTRKPPRDAGQIEFRIDGNRFGGRWRYGSTGRWHADWRGTRLP
jgi:hypothetical protein